MPFHRTRTSVAALAVALTIPLAGCGADPMTPVAAMAVATTPLGTTPTTGTSATTSPTPTTPAVPVRLSVAQAGKRYLEITRPHNVALEAFERAFNDGESVTRLQGLARKISRAAAAESAALSETAWPLKVESLTTSLARGDLRAEAAWQAVGRADSRDAMLAAVRKLPTGATTGAQIRRLLGLPKYNENDY